jgi:hypothetical protein
MPDRPWIPARRDVALALLALPAALALRGRAAAPAGDDWTVADGPRMHVEAQTAVTPAGGHRSRIAFGDSLVRLADAGVIDRDRLAGLRRVLMAPRWPLDDPLVLQPGRIGVTLEATVPVEVVQALDWPSPEPIHLTAANAGHLLNLLWPVGLANRMAANADSPIRGPMLARFASTSGWTLGRAANGADYFDRFPIVPLSPAQEDLVVEVAGSTWRPCCDNSTFFQDCNHGSALLGLLQLGAAQGLGKAELYAEALAFNAFWFPDAYRETALYLRLVEGIAWADVDPARVMGYELSALGPWTSNVHRTLARIPGLLEPPTAAVSCSL